MTATDGWIDTSAMIMMVCLDVVACCEVPPTAFNLSR